MKIKSLFYAMLLNLFSSSVCLSEPTNKQPLQVISGTDISVDMLAHSQQQLATKFSWQEVMQKPSLMRVKLAPDGQHLVYLLKEKKGNSLWLMKLENKHVVKLLHSVIVTDVHWSKDSQLLFLESATNMAYINLQAVDHRPELFIKFNNDLKESFYAIDQSQLGHILIRREVKQHNKNRRHELVRVGIDGQQTILFSGEKRIYDHLFNASGQLQFIRQAGTDKHHIYHLNGDQTKLVFTSNAVDKVEMVGFDDNSNELTLVAYHDADLISVHAYNITTKKSQILFDDPEHISDLSGVVKDSQSGEILLLKYFTDRLKTYAVHPTMITGMALINEALDGSIAVAADLSTPYWLVSQTGASIGHTRYYLYDVINHNIEAVLTHERDLNPGVISTQLPRSIPVSYTASDGMLIHGYVMLPTGLDLAEVPMLVYVHGGPFNRIYGRSSPWQYLVNQGYALFMPNFRASRGYGLTYMTAGKAQFSGRVQQDITEGVKYLLSQGVGSPDKLGVFGHSFGGYSVLSLLSSYPEFFQAGFASAAPTELLSTLFKLDQKDINSYDGIPLIKALSTLMVDLDDEQQIQQMNANSPAKLWQNINKPLFIWAGELDERVPIVDVKDYAIKLKNAGKPVELLVDKNTGHNVHPDDSVGRLAYRFLTEDFFAQHFNHPRPKPNQKVREYIKKFKVY